MAHHTRTPSERLTAWAVEVGINLATPETFAEHELRDIRDSLRTLEGDQIRIRAEAAAAKAKLTWFSVQKWNLENLKQGSKP